MLKQVLKTDAEGNYTHRLHVMHAHGNFLLTYHQ